MPLISLWNSNPEALSEMTIEQIVSAAGDRKFVTRPCAPKSCAPIHEVPSRALGTYVDYCLSNAIKAGGMVLQDLINEIGRRLDYEVANGRYQGIPSQIGYDGVWKSPDGNHLVVEVKTTDAYRISLDTIANYRRRLIDAEELGQASSILIIVGRQDTGELEAQIRGSRHAWDVRLISAEALLKLLQVKENSNQSDTGAKVRSLFAPVEYTRYDRMVDVVLTAATNVEVALDDPQPHGLDDGVEVVDLPTGTSSGLSGHKAPYQFTDGALLQEKRLRIIDALGFREGAHLLQKSRAQYWNAGHDVRAVCSISKRYEGKNQNPYWYAYHPQWDVFLDDANKAYFVLGCMDLIARCYSPRIDPIDPPKVASIGKEKCGAYWHIHLIERDGDIQILIPNSADGFPLEQFGFDIAHKSQLGEPVR